MKFKKQLALSLCALYVVSVIGIALSMHFCGGKLASVSVYAAKSACKICKAEASDKKDDGCCKNTKVDVKIKDSHQAQASFKLPKLFSFESFLLPSVHNVFKKLMPSIFGYGENESPPRASSVPIRVMNCVFRN